MNNYAFPSFGGTEFERQLLLGEPGAAFGRFLEGQQGRGKNYLDYLLGNQRRLYLGYQSDAARHPTASFLDYLTGSTGSAPDLYKEFTNLTPTERGERPQNFVGRVRYTGL